jgi:lysine decarboxylase
MSIYQASANNHKLYPTRFCLPSHLNRLDFSSLIHIDNTELDGLDDLADPTGIIAELETKLAKLFKANNIHITTNGATGANLAALDRIAQNYNRITIQRDSHISLYRALMLHDIEPVYLPPLADENFIHELNKNTGNSALWLTTPTYDGTALRKETISKYPYIHIDSALGSLLPIFGYHDYNDIAGSVTYSGHKGFPALTQTGFLVTREKLSSRNSLNTYNSTSPSYILLASIEKALEYIEKKGKHKWEKLASHREKILKECGVPNKTPDNTTYVADPTKLTITEIDGFGLYEALLSRGIVVENCGVDFITLFLSLLHTDEDIDRFIRNCNEVKREKPVLFNQTENKLYAKYINPVIKLTPYQAKKMVKSGKLLELHKSEGKISGSLVYLYPPGTPVLVPGEMITKEIIEHIKSAKSLGYNISGLNKDTEIMAF